MQLDTVCNNWTKNEIAELFTQPFADLIYQAQSIHRQFFDPNSIQLATLFSIKVGACIEDCAYCCQSAAYKTGVEKSKTFDKETVLKAAQAAKAAGATRFCMGGSWRNFPQKQANQVGELIKAVKDLGLETCITAGMLTDDQANYLKEVGLDFYNHNLDTSPEYYPKIISTRTYQDRLQTLDHVRQANIKICSGGILGMGESREDRISFLQQLANLPEHPQSVPINMLIPMAGTPLADQSKLDIFEFIRTIAVARILMPKAYVRLTAGRAEMSDEMQALCFLAGANSMFLGDQYLTALAPNQTVDHDHALLNKLGIKSVMNASKNVCTE